MDRPTIPCSCCGGAGRQPLPAPLYQTWQDLQCHTFCTTVELRDYAWTARQERISLSNLNNRLIKLMQHGLVDRYQSIHSSGGYHYVYWAIKKEGNKKK